jgi:hypothetical protein
MRRNGIDFSDMDPGDVKDMAADPNAGKEALIYAASWYPRIVLLNESLDMLSLTDPSAFAMIVQRCWGSIFLRAKKHLTNVSAATTSGVVVEYCEWCIRLINESFASSGVSPLEAQFSCSDIQGVLAQHRYWKKAGDEAGANSLLDCVNAVIVAARKLSRETGQPFAGLALERKALEELARIKGQSEHLPDLPYKPNARRRRR